MAVAVAVAVTVAGSVPVSVSVSVTVTAPVPVSVTAPVTVAGPGGGRPHALPSGLQWSPVNGADSPSWRERFEDLRRRRPDLAERVCRTLLTDMHRKGLVNLEELDDEFALLLKLGVKPRNDDPNRPLRQLPSGSSRTLYELALKHAERHMSPEEINATILLTEKRHLGYEVSRSAEDPETSLEVLREQIHEFLDFASGEAMIPREDVIGIRAALVRRLLTEQLDFISVAKRYIKVRDIAEILDHIIPTDGNQGRLGGKAAGLVLARSILKRAREAGVLEEEVAYPDSWFVPSNGILEFMEHNGLEDLINVKYRPVEEVRKEYPLVQRLFKSSSFPATLHDGLREMLEQAGQGPLVVRSSSLLEDRIGHAFSGKYKSLFIANTGSIEARLEALEDAIAEVYASIFGPDPIEYRRERGLLDFQEQMGILIQRVVGREIGGMVFPAFAGVAFSLCEMRWASRIQRTDGMARLVVGLGTRAVDRTGDDYPTLVALEQPTLRAVQQPDEIYRYSQHTVDVMDLGSREFTSLPLVEFMGRVGRKFPAANKVFSLYRQGQILPLIGVMAQFEPEELVVTFDGLLRSTFPARLKQILDLLQEGLGEPVDIEFAHDGSSFHLLQCRALSHRASAQREPVPANVPAERRVFSANRYVQTGQIRDQEWIVLVDPRDYERLPSEDAIRRVAQAVGAVNRTLPARKFILMGPGRWGSRGDIRLGVPITYADICHTSLLVEIARKKGSYLPDVSFGTHFFNDLVESQIAYLPLYPDDPDVVWNEAFLTGSPSSLGLVVPEFADMEEVVRLIDVPGVTGGLRLQIVMDGEEDRALAWLE